MRNIAQNLHTLLLLLHNTIHQWEVHVTSTRVQLLRREIKGLSHKEVYISYKIRLERYMIEVSHDRAIRVSEAANFRENFIEGASFSPGLPTSRADPSKEWRECWGSSRGGLQWGSCGTSYCQSRFALLYRDYRVQSPTCTASASIYPVDVSCKNRVYRGVLRRKIPREYYVPIRKSRCNSA